MTLREVEAHAQFKCRGEYGLWGVDVRAPSLHCLAVPKRASSAARHVLLWIYFPHDTDSRRVRLAKKVSGNGNRGLDSPSIPVFGKSKRESGSLTAAAFREYVVIFLNMHSKLFARNLRPLLFAVC